MPICRMAAVRYVLTGLGLFFAPSAWADTTPPTTPVVTDDGQYTTSTTTLHASWTSSDPESGIVEYQYQVRQVSSTGAVVADWTSTGTATQVTRSDFVSMVGKSKVNGLIEGRTYYFLVKARNGDNLWSAVGASDGITVDATPPSGSVYIGANATYAASSTVALSLAASDSVSAVARMRFSNDGSGYSSPEPFAASRTWTLASGDGPRTVWAQFEDGAGNWSQAASDTVIVDSSPPTLPVVTDDGATTSSLTQLHATWTVSSDPQSGIQAYEYQIRVSSPTGAVIRDWTSVGTATSVTATGLTLAPAMTYFIGARAVNGAGAASAAGFSNGITTPDIGTTVSGAITANTRWSLAGSPYRVTSTVTVSNNATLTVDPGVVVRFAANTGLVLGAATPGTLLARGAAALPITFTTDNAVPAPGQWNGLWLDNTTSHSIMDYCVVEFGGAGSNDANVRIDSATPTIIRSTIRRSDGYGLFITGVRPVITDNAFADNSGYPLYVEVENFPSQLRNNTFTSNSIQAVRLLGGTLGADLTLPAPGLPYVVSSSITVQSGNNYPPVTLALEPGTTLQFAAGTGLVIGDGSQKGVLHALGTAAQPITFTSASAAPASGQWNGVAFESTTPASIMDYCVVEYGGAGTNNANLRLNGAPVTIRHSTVRYSDGAGAWLSNAKPLMEYNTITGNDQGVVVAVANGQERIFHNTIAGNTTAGANNLDPINGLWIRLNWWGDASGPSGAEGAGDAILGPFGVEPWLAQPPSELFRWADARNRPDPFNPLGVATNFAGAFAQPANWSIVITDQSSAVVRTLNGSGVSFQQDWDGRNTGGAILPNGTYRTTWNATSVGSGQVAASAGGTVVLDSALAYGRITSPAHDALVSGTVSVIGTAAGSNFASYVVEYAQGILGTWQLLASSSTPVTNGVLATWNTSALTNDRYTLRLRVIPTSGLETVDFVNVRVVDGPAPTVTSVSTSPMAIDPYLNEVATIAYTLSVPGDVTIRLYQHWDGQLIRTLTLPQQPAGYNTAAWDGRNDGGQVGECCGYYFTIQVLDPLGRTGTYNNATSPNYGLTPPTSSDHQVSAVNFDPYKNQRLQLNYQFNGAPGDLRVVIRNSDDQIIRTLIWGAHVPGPHVLFWDGRRNDGSFHQGPFDVYWDVPLQLAENVIILLRERPGNAHFRAEPYLFQPALGDISTFSYQLTREFLVSIELIDPNGNVVRTLVDNVLQPAGAHIVEWDGRTDDGRVVAVEGDYRVRLEATDPVSGVLYWGNAVVLVYRP